MVCMGKRKKVQAPAQFFASACPAPITALMIAIVWFIMDMTIGLVLHTRKGSNEYFDDDGDGSRKSTYEFMLANASIASVRFPVT